MGRFKYKMDILESLAVTQFSGKLIAPTYLAKIIICKTPIAMIQSGRVKFYTLKKVAPIVAETELELVVITVYTFYF